MLKTFQWIFDTLLPNIGFFKNWKGEAEKIFARDVAYLTIGAACAQCISFAATPVLARIYGPSDYGVFAIFTAVISILSTIVTLRYEVRIMLPMLDSEAGEIVISAIIVSLISSFILLGMSLLLTETTISYLSLNGIKKNLPLTVVLGSFIAINTIFTTWLTRLSKFKEVSFIRIIGTLIGSVSSILIGCFLSKDGLLYGFGISALASLLFYLFFAVKIDKTLKKVSFLEIKKTLVSHVRAPAYLLPTALLDTLTIQLPFFLLSLWFSEKITGEYRMANQFLSIPAVFIGGAIAQVFFQRFSKTWPEAVEAKRILINTWKTLGAVGIIPLIVVIFFGDYIFNLILGSEWSYVGDIAAIMAPMAFFSLVHSATSTTLIVMGYEKWYIFFGLATLIYRPLSLYIGHHFNSLYLGLGLFITFEIIQMLLFQFIAIDKINRQIIQTSKVE